MVLHTFVPSYLHTFESSPKLIRGNSYFSCMFNFKYKKNNAMMTCVKNASMMELITKVQRVSNAFESRQTPSNFRGFELLLRHCSDVDYDLVVAKSLITNSWLTSAEMWAFSWDFYADGQRAISVWVVFNSSYVRFSYKQWFCVPDSFLLVRATLQPSITPILQWHCCNTVFIS